MLNSVYYCSGGGGEGEGGVAVAVAVVVVVVVVVKKVCIAGKKLHLNFTWPFDLRERN